jgi:hypothetical protein
MKAGDTVMLIGIPPDVRDDGVLQTRTLFEKCLGQSFVVVEMESIAGSWEKNHTFTPFGSNLNICKWKVPDFRASICVVSVMACSQQLLFAVLGEGVEHVVTPDIWRINLHLGSFACSFIAADKVRLGERLAPPRDACRKRRVINSPSGAGFYGSHFRHGLLRGQQEAVGVAVAVGLIVACDRSSRVDALRENESCAGDFKGGDGTVGPTQESARNALRVTRLAASCVHPTAALLPSILQQRITLATVPMDAGGSKVVIAAM